MSKTKRILAFALAAVLAVVVLTGCKSIAQKVFGSSNEVQEDTPPSGPCSALTR